MKISQYIYLGFIFILLLFSATTFINFKLSEAVIENTTFVSRSTEITKTANRFQRNILTMVDGLHSYLLTGEKLFILSYEEANKENDDILRSLSTLVDQQSRQGKLLQEIKQLNDQWTDEYTEPLKQAKTLAIVSPRHLEDFNRVYRNRRFTGDEERIQRQLKAKFREFTTIEYSLRDMHRVKLADSTRLTRELSLIMNVASILVALLVIRFIIKKISRRIERMNYMARMITEGNYDVRVGEPEADELEPLRNSLNHMAEALSDSFTLLRKSNQELDQYAHVVSHDLKGPLRGIKNIVTWIEEDHHHSLTPEVNNYLQLIKERVHWGESLIEGLLSYSRLDRDQTSKELVDVNELVKEVLDILTPPPNFTLKLDPLPQLYTERILLQQVFLNLVSNGIKYNRSERIEIQIYAQEQETAFQFFVADNGIGIEPQYFDRIFSIFQTLGELEHEKSTGVGLAIVKKILDNKKQVYQVLSEPGKGSVFSFTWPKS